VVPSSGQAKSLTQTPCTSSQSRCWTQLISHHPTSAKPLDMGGIQSHSVATNHRMD